jgi:hypothetical protein
MILSVTENIFMKSVSILLASRNNSPIFPECDYEMRYNKVPDSIYIRIMKGMIYGG